jgi:hypothetical protein
MTHDVCTYQAGRQVRVRAVRGELQRDRTRCDKRRTLRARGPHRRIEQAQHAGAQSRCMTHSEHILSREVGEGENGQRRAAA